MGKVRQILVHILHIKSRILILKIRNINHNLNLNINFNLNTMEDIQQTFHQHHLQKAKFSIVIGLLITVNRANHLFLTIINNHLFRIRIPITQIKMDIQQEFLCQSL